MQMRGACSSALVQAVPHVATFGQSVHPEVLTDRQRRAFLASFTQKSSNARRDHAMALCMVDLGLRSIEVVRLRLGDIDWERKILSVPATKTGRGRQLPLPRHVARTLEAYIPTRPAGHCDRLFVGHHFQRGQPISTGAVRAAMSASYRRCGFPRSWNGAHRLRHSFATRLFARGADLKHIADLLGHQSISTTNLYAQVDLKGLRALAQPWPL
ncbi:MAG: tyrosine-type recombinase/integrase [Opitutus sp.]